MKNDLPIVLLHGSATGSQSWAAVRSGLEAQGTKVLAPDMLGYDRSSGAVSLLTGVPPMSVEDFVRAHRNDFMKADAREP